MVKVNPAARGAFSFRGEKAPLVRPGYGEPGEAIRFGENIYLIGADRRLTTTRVDGQGNVLPDELQSGKIRSNEPKDYYSAGKGGPVGDAKITYSEPGSLTGGGAQSLSSGVYVGGKGEQVIVKEGAKAQTAGQLVDAVRPGPFTPSVGNQSALREKVVGVRQGAVFNLGPDRVAVTDEEGKTKVYNSVILSDQQDERRLSGVPDRTANSSSPDSTRPQEVRSISPGYVRPVPKKELTVLSVGTGVKYDPKNYDYYSQQAMKSTGLKAAGYQALAFSVGVFKGLTAPVLETKQFILGIKETVRHPIKTTFAVGRQLKEEPAGTAGELFGSAASFKGLAKASSSIKLGGRTVEVPTATGGVKVKTYGVEAGTRAQPLVTLSPEGVKLLTPTFKNKIPPAELTSQVAAPEGALGGAIFRRLLDLTPEEQARISSSIRATRLLQQEPGLPVKQAFFNLESVKNPARTTQIVESFAKREGGIFFGSATTQQLPKGFQNIKIGDVDIVFPRRSVNELTPKLRGVAAELRKVGEDAQISKQNPLIIENPRTRAKIVEAKSGVDQVTLGEELAPAGFYGIRFADLKAGQSPSTVPFGQARAIKAGEQFARKGAAVNIVRPASAEAVPGLQEAGVLGKAQRSAKDIAGFIQSGRGIIAIREGQHPLARFLKGPATKRAAGELTTFEQSFSPTQRQAIDLKLSELLGEGRRVRLLTSEEVQAVTTASANPGSYSSGVAAELSVSVATPLRAEPTGARAARTPSGRNARTIPEPSRTSLVRRGFVDRELSSFRQSGGFRSSVFSSAPRIRVFSASPSAVSRSSPSALSTLSSASPSARSPSSPGSSASSSPRLTRATRSALRSLSPRASLSPRSSVSPRVIRPSLSPPPSRDPENRSKRLRIKRKGEDKDDEPTYDVLIRRFGKFRPVNSRGLRLEEAFARGQAVVKQTAAASFKIVTRYAPKPKNSVLFPLKKTLGTPGKIITEPPAGLDTFQIRRSKREPGVFVEKSQFRLSDLPEKMEITTAGIRASRRKRR